MSNTNTKPLKDRLLAALGRKANTIALELTTHCPLKCKYCKMDKIDMGGIGPRRHLSWEKFLEINERLNGFQRILLCGMGETMVYPRIYDVVSSLKQNVIMVTSGTVRIDYEALNRSGNVEVIMFSVDAPSEKEMVEMTGNYNWQNLMHNLKRSRYNSRIVMSINCTVLESNYQRIPDLTRFAIRHKLQTVNVNYAIKDNGGNGDIELKKNIHRYLEKAEAVAKSNGLSFTSSFKQQLTCTNLIDLVPLTNIDGDVFTCCRGMETSYKVGNIFETMFDDMWNGSAYNKFKRGDLCFNGCPVYSDRTRSEEIKNDRK